MPVLKDPHGTSTCGGNCRVCVRSVRHSGTLNSRALQYYSLLFAMAPHCDHYQCHIPGHGDRSRRQDLLLFALCKTFG
jgi:hypothetical protein